MAAREIGAKKYIVKLSEAERNHLQALINKGKSPAKRLLKARILLKADAGAQGENWSDGEIIEALDTNQIPSGASHRVNSHHLRSFAPGAIARSQARDPAINFPVRYELHCRRCAVKIPRIMFEVEIYAPGLRI